MKVVNASTSGTVAEYAYDGRNFRIVKRRYTSGVLSETRHSYHTAGWQVIEERVGQSSVVERHFVWGLRYIDDLILRDRDTNFDGTLEERLYAMQDANWNVVAIANASGALQERYIYTAYGTPTFRNGYYWFRSASSYDWETLFTGRQYDRETGLGYFRMRYQGSLLGAFKSRDPIGYFVTDPNLYRCVGNRPIGSTDPTGLAPNRVDAACVKELVTWARDVEKAFPEETPGQHLIRLRDRIVGQRYSTSGGSGSGASPANTPQNTPMTLGRVPRWGYIYTTEAGWIDLGHFVEAGRYAQTYWGPVVVAGGFLTEIVQGLQGLLTPWRTGTGSSCFSREDLPSNSAGASFGRGLRGDVPLSTQLQDFFTRLGATAPENAPDYNELKCSEQEVEDEWQRYKTKCEEVLMRIN